MKNKGGLGMRRAKLMNKAMLMKLGWGPVEKRDGLWVHVLRTKYGSDIVPIVRKRKGNIQIHGKIYVRHGVRC